MDIDREKKREKRRYRERKRRKKTKRAAEIQRGGDGKTERRK